MKKLIFIIIISLYLVPLFAAEKTAKKKLLPLTIAVMNLQTNNCPASYGRAIADMLSGRLFNMKNFVLMEKTQAAIIMQQKKLNISTCRDETCLARVGAALKVQKILVGSVTKLGDYIITVRIIDTATNNVDLSLTEKVSNELSFEGTMKVMAFYIRNHYLGRSSFTGRVDVIVTGGFVHTLGEFSQGAGSGFGTSLYVSINRPFRMPFSAMLSASYYRLGSNKEIVDHLQIMPLQLHLVYPFYVTENLRLFPSLGAGYLFSLVKHDRDSNQWNGMQAVTEFFYNPLFSLRCEVNLLIYHRLFIIFAPGYYMFFENSGTGHFMIYEAGLRYRF